MGNCSKSIQKSKKEPFKKEIIRVTVNKKKEVPKLQELKVNSLYQNRLNRNRKQSLLLFEPNEDIDINISKKITSLNENLASMKTMERIKVLYG